MSELYTVIHETPMSPERTDYGVAGSIWDFPPVNHLAYCRALQEEGRPGTGGRYFIARLVEIDDPEVTP